MAQTWWELARWLAQAERYEEAIRLYRRRRGSGTPRRAAVKTQWKSTGWKKKLERYELAIAVYRTWRRPEIPIACRFWKSWPSITSAAERTTHALEMTRSALSLEDLRAAPPGKRLMEKKDVGKKDV